MYLVYFSTYKLGTDKLSTYKLITYKNTLPTMIDNVRIKFNLHLYSSMLIHLLL